MEELKNENTRVVKQFYESCNSLAKQVNEAVFHNTEEFWWCGNIVGGVCAFGNTDILSVDEMAYILENQLEASEIREWMDYTCNHIPQKGKMINLRSWHTGCRPETLKNKEL